MNHQFSFASVVEDALRHAVLEILQISISENYICLSPEEKLQLSNRKFQNACFVVNVNWFVPEE